MSSLASIRAGSNERWNAGSGTITIVTNTELLCLESPGVKICEGGESWMLMICSSGWLRLAPVLHSQSKLGSPWFITPFQYAANSNPCVHSAHVQLTPITHLVCIPRTFCYGLSQSWNGERRQFYKFPISQRAEPPVLSATLWARHDVSSVASWAMRPGLERERHVQTKLLQHIREVRRKEMCNP